VRIDARAGSVVPLGGVDTGAGGTAAPGTPASPVRGFVLAAVALLAGIAVLLTVPPVRRRVLAPAKRRGQTHW
jgi:hypothetical protein